MALGQGPGARGKVAEATQAGTDISLIQQEAQAGAAGGGGAVSQSGPAALQAVGDTRVGSQ